MYTSCRESDHEALLVCLTECDDRESEVPPVARLHRASAERTAISEIMTTRVTCVRGDLDLGSVERLLLENGFSGMPVVDDACCPIGIVSKTDVLRARHQHQGDGAFAAQRVADIMMPLAFCLPANESLAKAAALMAFESVHRVPVVGAGGKVVGLVSPLDILRWLAREHGYVIADPQ